MLLVSIFNDVASGIVLELAALAAAATPAVSCALDVGSEVELSLLPPPHAVSASESEQQTLPDSARRALTFNRVGLTLLTVLGEPVGLPLYFLVRIFVHPFRGSSSRFTEFSRRLRLRRILNGIIINLNEIKNQMLLLVSQKIYLACGI